MSDDNSDEFDNLVGDVQLVEPLSLASVAEGLRIITEATLYIEDFLSESIESVQEFVESFMDSKLTTQKEMEEALEMDMPAFSMEATMYLTWLINAAKQFCEAVAIDDEDDYEDDD